MCRNGIPPRTALTENQRDAVSISVSRFHVILSSSRTRGPFSFSLCSAKIYRSLGAEDEGGAALTPKPTAKWAKFSPRRCNFFPISVFFWIECSNLFCLSLPSLECKNTIGLTGCVTCKSVIGLFPTSGQRVIRTTQTRRFVLPPIRSLYPLLPPSPQNVSVI